MAFPKVYKLTPEQMAACRARLTELGHEVTEEKVTITKPAKVVLGHTYDNGKLTLSLIEKPWFVHEDLIAEKLDEQIGTIA